MQQPVSTNDPGAVEQAVLSTHAELYPEADPSFVHRSFQWTVACFRGGCPGYQEVDTRYHDLEHTMQGTLCMARLLRGRHRAGALPRLPGKVFELGMLAILLHDSGYLKKLGDTEGTGAKYTLTHVDRSAEFAAELLGQHGYEPADISSVQSMIRCTGVNAAVARIPFTSEEARIAGYALATADYLGQMAAPDYPDKLTVLFEEFAEAVQFSGDNRLLAGFSSPEDLLRNTPRFWANFVKPKLETEFLGLYQFLNDPYPDGPNEYVQSVEANIAEIQRRIAR